MMTGNSREKNRMERRDKIFRQARYAPRQGGLPLGKPKAYWQQRKAAVGFVGIK